MESKFLDAVERNCNKKSDLLGKDFFRYSLRAILAGAMLTLASMTASSAGDQINKLHPSLGRFANAFLFSFGLIYILYLGLELATSNMMYMSAGSYKKKISFSKGIYIVAVCTFFNLIGAIITGYLFSLSGILSNLPADGMLVKSVTGRILQSNSEIFFSSIMANVFVNIAILAFVFMKEESAKNKVIMSAIFMFVFLGLNHLIANFSSFSLYFFSNLNGQIENFTLLNVLRHWLVGFLGNYFGGGLVIGLSYAWLNSGKTAYMD